MRKYFEVVEKHLGELVTEYESERREAAHAEGGISIYDMPRLEDFLSLGYRGTFRAGVAGPINSILSDLRTALLEPLELPAPAVTG